ncbi:MAG: NAD-dependent epimerase/dehydratase family protein [Mycobacterium sp.]|uniref:NAD-dependent epimerase/dehydratase family protein n=1 Tax=Mycobacterium sp. TaxID=1785 RepID=UPI003C429356
MRILLTGVTGMVGRAVARQLLATGSTVSGIAAQPHENLDPSVDFVCGPLGGPMLEQLAEDADVVLHLAPIEAAAPGSAGISGLVQVARAGARLIYLSQSAGQPWLYQQAESLVSTSWAPSLIVRVAPLMGRQLDWMICRTVGSLVHSKDSATPLRLLHFDDLLRFLVLAVTTNRTGQVDLATVDTTEIATARRLLRSVELRPRLSRLPTWPQLIPELDVEVARDDWNFEFGWRASEAVTDTSRGLAARGLDARGAVDLPGRLPIPLEVAPRTEPSDGTQLRSATPDGLEGEFDDRIDPRFPVFSATTLAEALPGPLTPMTLDVQLSGLRAANQLISRVMAVGDVVAGEWGSRAIAVFGHRPYVGVSASVIAAPQLPGWDSGEVVQQSLGNAPVDQLLPLGPPPLARGLLGYGTKARKALVVKRAMVLLRHLRADTEAYVSAATDEHLAATQLTSLPDADLQVRTRLLRDRIHQGWGLCGLWLIDTGITAATVERIGLHAGVSGVALLVQSDAVEGKTSSLAALIRNDPQLCRLALDADLDGIAALSRSTATAFTAAIARIGHRGLGEIELANLMFVDDPAMLLVAAGRAATAVPRPMPSDASATKLSERMAASARASRELAYDTTMRFTHELRMTLRELGSRLVAADVIDVAGEVFYLTCAEAVTVPADARLRIKRRRAERERLQSMRLPDVIGIS